MILYVDAHQPWFKQQFCYQCFWCARWALKDDWGPGRTLCPHCQRRAPTAEEFKRFVLKETP